MKSLLEKFVKDVIAEDLKGFLKDTVGIHYSEYSDDDSQNIQTFTLEEIVNSVAT